MDNDGTVIFNVPNSVIFKRVYEGPVNIKWFGAVGDGINNDDTAIQNALNAAPFSSQILIPTGEYRLRRPLVVPKGISIIGEGGSSVLKPDFSSTIWQGLDYRVLIISTAEVVYYGGKEYNQIFKDFSIVGINSAAIASIGIDVRTNSNINVNDAVRYSLVYACFENILLMDLDTGLNLKECWDSNFKSLIIKNCKKSINIAGKCMNLNFLGIKTSYTNALFNTTIGINVDSAMYNNREGIPEGIIFTDCTIFGAFKNLNISKCIYFRIHDCVLDGAQGDCIVIGSANNVSISGCYIFTEGMDSKNILIDQVAISDSKISIDNNQIVGQLQKNNYGIYSFSSTRIGVVISNNYISNCKYPLYFNYVNGSKIINNYGKYNYGIFIYFQSEGANTIIDGNISDDNYPILMLDPTTNQNLKIGDNNSTYQGNIISQTSFKGYVIKPANTNSVQAPNFMYNSELYYRVITIITPDSNMGNTWVVNQYSWSLALINFSDLASFGKVHYQAIAVPISASI